MANPFFSPFGGTADPSGGGGGISGSGLTGGLFGAAGGILSILGGEETSKAQQQVYQESAQIAGAEKQINEQRRQQMVLQTQRQQMENVRNVQKARSIGLAAVTNQGGGGGIQSSAYGGGQAAASAAGGRNEVALAQNEQIGQNIFNLNDQISDLRIAMAGEESKAAAGSGLSQLGGAIGKAAPLLGMAFPFPGL